MDLPVSGKLFIISENLISGTVILHDYDFKILITGILLQHFQTGLKGLFLVFVWYDNRHQRFSLHRIFHPVKAQILCMAYLAFLYLFSQDELLLLSLPASNAYILLAGLSAVEALCVLQ